MYRPCRLAILAVLTLVLALSACGPGAEPTSAPPPAPTNTEAPRPTLPPQATPVQPLATEAQALPTRPADQATPALVPEVGDSFDRMMELPGFHFEGVLREQKDGQQSEYIRFVEDVDADGNFHLLAYEEEGGQPVLELYYVDKHLYVGSGGQFIDMGEQMGDQAALMYQAYLMPFSAALLGAANLERVGQETVNGMPATKYHAEFDQWVSAYIQTGGGAGYAAEGDLWVSDEHHVVVKSQVTAQWVKDEEEHILEVQSEVSQVGQVAPIEVPPGAVSLPQP